MIWRRSRQACRRDTNGDNQIYIKSGKEFKEMIFCSLLLPLFFFAVVVSAVALVVSFSFA